MSRAILTELGWENPLTASFNSNHLTGSGRVAVAGAFAYLRVLRIEGGTLPTVSITHGRVPGGPSVASVAAREGAALKPAKPVDCPNGIYLEVTGNPRHIECEVLYR